MPGVNTSVLRSAGRSDQDVGVASPTAKGKIASAGVPTAKCEMTAPEHVNIAPA